MFYCGTNTVYITLMIPGSRLYLIIFVINIANSTRRFGPAWRYPLASALPDHVESRDRKGIAQIQRVGACPCRKSRATFSGHALTGEGFALVKLNFHARFAIEPAIGGYVGGYPTCRGFAETICKEMIPWRRSTRSWRRSMPISMLPLG